MKIVHLTVGRELTQGQIKQLHYEFEAAKRLEAVEWDTVAYHNGPTTEPFMRSIPRFFRSLFMRKLFQWLVAYRLSKHYDVVMLRHMTFDPFAPVFAPLIRNRISVHHAKEVAELRLIREGWQGRAASTLERFTGRVAARHAVALFGVTQEIAEYVRDLHKPEIPIGVYSNGIDPAGTPLLDDARDSHAVAAAFICGTFSSWHGLDKLISAVDALPQVPHPTLPTIHLIGELSYDQKHEIVATENRRIVFRAHGLMSEAEYRPILATCDVGIASLALERKALREASTLKVREMLALGIPVYSGHTDLALSPDESFVEVVRAPDILGLVEFAGAMKRTPRQVIRGRSLTRIAKLNCMLGVVQRLEELASQGLVHRRPDIE